MQRSIYVAILGALLIPLALALQPDGYVMYQTNTVTSIRGDNWTNTDFTAGFDTLQNVGGQPQHMANVWSHKRNESLVIVLDDQSDINFVVINMTNKATIYTTEFTASAPVLTARMADVAYESISGRGIIVWDSNTADTTVNYSIWNGTALSFNGTVTLPSLSSTRRYMRLVPRPMSNDIMLIYNDALSDISAILWNGTGWQAGIVATGTGAAPTNRRPMDFVWYPDGNGIYFYANAPGTNGVYYRNFTYATKQWSADTIALDIAAIPQALDACANPNNKYVGVITTDSTGDANAFMWNGDAVETSPTRPTEDATVETAGHNSKCEWEKSGTQALFVYIDANALAIDYFHYNLSSDLSTRAWSLAALGGVQTANVAADDIESIKAVASPYNDSIMIMFKDLLFDVRALLWDGNNILASSANFIVDADSTGGAVTNANSQSFDYMWNDFPSNPPQFVGSVNDSSNYTNPTNKGTNITFNAQARDNESNTWRLVVCTGTEGTLRNATCYGTALCNSSLVSSNTQASCSITTTTYNEGNYSWFAYTCDNNSMCSSYENSTAPFVINEGPSFSSLSVTPTVAANGSTVTISAAVSDTRGVSSTKAEVYYPNGTLWQNITMSGSGTYSASITAPLTPLGNYDIYIWANDTLNAANRTQTTGFTPYINHSEIRQVTIDGSFTEWSTVPSFTDERNDNTATAGTAYWRPSSVTGIGNAGEPLYSYDNDYGDTSTSTPLPTIVPDSDYIEYTFNVHQNTTNATLVIAAQQSPGVNSNITALNKTSLASDHLLNLENGTNTYILTSDYIDSDGIITIGIYNGLGGTNISDIYITTSGTSIDYNGVQTPASPTNATITNSSSSVEFGTTTKTAYTNVSYIDNRTTNSTDYTLSGLASGNETYRFAVPSGSSNFSFYIMFSLDWNPSPNSFDGIISVWNYSLADWQVLSSGLLGGPAVSEFHGTDFINNNIVLINMESQAVVFAGSEEVMLYTDYVQLNVQGVGSTPVDIANYSIANDKQNIYVRAAKNGILNASDVVTVFFRTNKVVTSTTAPSGEHVMLYDSYVEASPSSCVVRNTTGTVIGTCTTANDSTTMEVGILLSDINANIGQSLNMTIAAGSSAAYSDFAPNKDSFISYTPRVYSATIQAPANNTVIDRDEASADPDSILLSTTTTAPDGTVFSFMANLTQPSALGITNVVLGTNTSTAGVSTYSFNPDSTVYTGNYTWWPDTAIANNTNYRTILIYGNYSVVFNDSSYNPNSTYFQNESVTVNANTQSTNPDEVAIYHFGAVTATITNTSGGAALHALGYSLPLKRFQSITPFNILDLKGVGIWNVSLTSSADFFYTPSVINRTFTVYGFMNITANTTTPSTVNLGDSVTSTCQVLDQHTNYAVNAASVSFYEGASLLGTNTTNASGHAHITYTPSTLGTNTITCNITDQLSLFYYAGDEAQRTMALTVIDATPPVISAESVNDITSYSAVIAWTTDDSSDSTVNYGVTNPPGSSVINPTLTQTHEILLSGLTQDTVYYYNITSCNAGGLCSNTTTLTFRTKKLDVAEQFEQGVCTAIVVEQGANYRAGYISKGDVVEFYCEMPHRVQEREPVTLTFTNTNKQLRTRIETPLIHGDEVALYP